MPISKEEQEFVNYVVDLMQSVGPVYSKRMFGGFGVFLEGLMFGLIAGNTLYLKVDDDSVEDFHELGLEPFTYFKKGKPYQLAYYQSPEETMESAEEMKVWANKAYGCALRAVAKKRK